MFGTKRPGPGRKQRPWDLPFTILTWLSVLLVGGWLLSHVAKTILVVVLSGVIAFALTPLVSLLSRRLPRDLSIALAYTLGVAVLLGVLGLVAGTAANELTSLVRQLPAYQRQLQRLDPQIYALLQPFGATHGSIASAQQHGFTSLRGIGADAAAQSLHIVTGLGEALTDAVLILILSVYLIANGPKIAQRLYRETPEDQRWRTGLLISIVDRVVGGYVRGTLTMATLIGVLVGGGMLVLQVPYAILLGVLAFVLEFVPIIGVFISGAMCVLLALSQGWVKAVVVLGYFVIVHVIEGDIVGPRVMGKALGIHPATTLIALIAGTEVFGFWGAVFAAPLAGLVQTLGAALWRELRGQDPREVVRPGDEQRQPDTVPATTLQHAP